MSIVEFLSPSALPTFDATTMQSMMTIAAVDMHTDVTSFLTSVQSFSFSVWLPFIFDTLLFCDAELTRYSQHGGKCCGMKKRFAKVYLRFLRGFLHFLKFLLFSSLILLLCVLQKARHADKIGTHKQQLPH